MKKIICIILILLNLFTIFMLFNLLKEKDFTTRVAITLAATIIMYILANIIYLIADLGITSKTLESTKNLVKFAILPINIIAIGFTGLIIKGKESLRKNKKKRNLFLVISIIIVLIEIGYLREIFSSISKKELNKNISNEITALEKK